MVLDSRVFALNESDVVSERFDDEIVLINLKSGYYYSINSAGVLVVEMILNAVPLSGIAEGFRDLTVEMPDGFETSLKSFIRRLEEEGLIIPAAGTGTEKAAGIEPDYEKFFREITAVTGLPELEKYTDQRELLLLDPIHEVSDFGWPVKDDIPDGRE